MNSGRACRLAVLVPLLSLTMISVPTAFADDEPDPVPAMFSSTATAFGETLRVEGRTEEGTRRHQEAAAARAPQTFEFRYEYVLHCGNGGEVIFGGSGRCAEDKCVTVDGRTGRSYIIYKYRVEVATGRDSREPSPGVICRPTEGAPKIGLNTLILREFESLTLPALEVRSSPEGRTFVHLTTTFSVERPKKNYDLDRILGHRVTVTIRPVSYRWSFGDGSVRTTSAHDKRAPDASVKHSFDQPTRVEVSVRTTYRAKYRVDGGRAQEIRESVSVDGPATVLPVEQARTELVAVPR